MDDQYLPSLHNTHPVRSLCGARLQPGLPYSSLSLQVKDNSIAPHKDSKGAKSFMDCDLVNFDQSLFPQQPDTEDGRLLSARDQFLLMGEKNGPCPP